MEATSDADRRAILLRRSGRSLRVARRSPCAASIWPRSTPYLAFTRF